MRIAHVFGSLIAGILIHTASVQAADEMKFQVQGKNPGGESGYQGGVTLTKISASTAKVEWVTGPNKDVTQGVALRSDKTKTVGAAYGGDNVYGLAIYELDGKRIRALWTLTATAKTSDEYYLTGSAFSGKCPFADGTPGGITFTPGKDGMYTVKWELPSGNYEGIGVKLGKVLVAASGNPKGNFGVAGYSLKGDGFEGLWATNGAPGAGIENWLPQSDSPSAQAKPVSGNGTSLEFGGDTYYMRENKSAPGQPVSELREYLQKGQTWDNYGKMVALRLHSLKTDADKFAQVMLNDARKKYPGTYVQEILMTPEVSRFIYILVSGDDVEFNLWEYRKAKAGLFGTQFVLRNKPPYDTQKKFKAEQDKNIEDWLKDLGALADQNEEYLKLTAGVQPVEEGETNEGTGSDDIPPELVKAIKADIDKCTVIAKKFMVTIGEGKTTAAVALMGKSAFKTSAERATYVSKVEASNKTLGSMQDLKPDNKATNFAMKDGVMTFTLEVDVEYEKGKTREVLTFIKNKAGDVEMVGYARTAKE